MNRRTRTNSRRPRGFAIAIVLWAVALAAIVLVALQTSAARQAAAGREALARVRAHWAARAGVETMITRLQFESTQAMPLTGQALLDAMAGDSRADLTRASFRVVHSTVNGLEDGPVDAHSKINVNLMTFDDLMLLENMTEDVADSILDWIDADDEPLEAGAEIDSYGGLTSPYHPRNGPISDLRELLLVRGMDPELLHGKDRNGNGIIDSGELSADSAFPSSGDPNLDSGWSRFITASSISGGVTSTGEERIDLGTADASQVQSLLGVESNQAEAIVSAAQQGKVMADFISTDLAQLAPQQNTQQAAQGGQQRQVPPVALTRQQLTDLLDKCCIGDPTAVFPGKLNINTCDEQALDYLATFYNSPSLKDTLLLYKSQMGGEIASFADLQDIPTLSRAQLAQLYAVLDVRSNVFIVTSRGRDEATGVEVEIVAEIDRSTSPVTIRSIFAR